MSEKTNKLDALLGIMARLRDPEHGCAWDLQQDFASVAPHTIEEAYEVVDAIDRGDHAALREELGDLLFQVVFHARMAEEAALFNFDDVAGAMGDKLVRRHPHVFAGVTYADMAEQQRGWEAIKAEERALDGHADASALAGIARGLPEWRRALKLQQRAGMVGFDWPDPAPVLDKLAEELDEVRAEFAADGSRARIEEEIGDMLFVLVNLTRHAGVDFSRALRGANAKFERRFRRMEALAEEQGEQFAGCSLDQQNAWWNQAKAEEP